MKEDVHGSAGRSVREDVARQGTAWLRSLRRRGTEFASAVMVRRAQVIDMSRRGYSAPEIADALDATGDWVRKVIHEFNDIGLEALVPAWGGGRPRVITDEMRARIVEIVDSRPQELGEPYVDLVALAPAYLSDAHRRGEDDLEGAPAGDPPRRGPHHPVHQGLEALA